MICESPCSSNSKLFHTIGFSQVWTSIINSFILVDVDKASLFDGGPKSLVVVGFIQQNEIPIHLAIGDGSMVFQPIEGNQVSSYAFFLSIFSDPLLTK